MNWFDSALYRVRIAHLRSRPKRWEDAAIALLIELCRETGCPVHVVHLSSSTAVPALRAEDAQGKPAGRRYRTTEHCAP